MSQSTLHCFFFLCLLSLQAIPTKSDDFSYAKSLLKFKKSLSNTAMLDEWKEPVVENLCMNSTPVWAGCLCLNSSFVGLRLEGMGLGGTPDINALSELPMVSLSLMNNSFSGPFPKDIKKLKNLRSLYLANNSFSGEIPNNGFSGLKNMKKVLLGYNSFTGKIPKSLLGLGKLLLVQIQNNEFDGRIPEFPQANLTVNFAYNNLQGAIPVTLGNNIASSFAGNAGLCGKPLDPCKPNKSITKIA